MPLMRFISALGTILSSARAKTDREMDDRSQDDREATLTPLTGASIEGAEHIECIT